jgi:hypothetical protein
LKSALTLTASSNEFLERCADGFWHPRAQMRALC